MMNENIDIIVIFMIVIVGISLGYLFYKYVVRTTILEPNCLIDTNTCVKIAYWSYGDSVLFHMEPSGYWVWYNGTDLYLYDSISNSESCTQSLSDCEDGQNCRNVTFSPAYKIPKVPFVYSTESTYENVCIENVDQLIEYYESLNVKKKYLHERVAYQLLNSMGYSKNGYRQPSMKFDVFDAMKLFENKNIIQK